MRISYYMKGNMAQLAQGYAVFYYKAKFGIIGPGFYMMSSDIISCMIANLASVAISFCDSLSPVLVARAFAQSLIDGQSFNPDKSCEFSRDFLAYMGALFTLPVSRIVSRNFLFGFFSVRKMLAVPVGLFSSVSFRTIFI